MKIKKENRKAMHDLLDVCIDLQNKGLCAFCDYSGHVNWFNINIGISKTHYSIKLYDAITPYVDSKAFIEYVKKFKKEKNNIYQKGQIRKDEYQKAKIKELEKELRTLKIK